MHDKRVRENSRNEIRRMGSPVDLWKHSGLVNRGVCGGLPVRVDSSLVGPMFIQNKDSRIVLGMIDLEANAAGFGTR